MAAPLKPVVLVTGGTGALGRAVVRRFVRDGAAVHATWVTEPETDEAESSGVTLHRTDVTNESEVEGLLADVAQAAGRLDVLANIVGGFAYGSLDQTDVATWDRMIALNATSAFLCCKAAVPLMRRSGGGRIINVAATPAVNRGAANMSAYGASKAAVLNFTESLAKELRSDGITVNAIVPSIIDTPANRDAMPRSDSAGWLAPEEIAGVVAFLSSGAAAIVTGTAVNLARG